MSILVVDIALILYFSVTLVALYGFILFVSWWMKSKCHASSVYYYIMFLFLCIAVDNTMCTIARYVKLNDSDLVYDALLQTIYWKLRIAPLLIILLCITVHMTYRWLVKKVVDTHEDC